MAATAKAVLLAKKIFDIIEKEGWKRVSGAFCVGIITIFVGIGSADIVHVWINGVSIPYNLLHANYLWELTKMFLLVYGGKHLLPFTVRIISLAVFKGDPETIKLLFGIDEETNTPTKSREVKPSGDD